MSKRETRHIVLRRTSGEVSSCYDAEYTNHSEEIAALRAESRLRMALIDPSRASYEDAILIAAFEASAALLEVHDDTGISLDDWIGPREVVERCLESIGRRDTFLRNEI